METHDPYTLQPLPKTLRIGAYALIISEILDRLALFNNWNTAHV